MTNPDNVGGLIERLQRIQQAASQLREMLGDGPHCEQLSTINGQAALTAENLAELCRAAPAGGDDRPDADWYRRNIEREPDDIGAGVPSIASPKGWVMVPAEPTAEMLRAGAIVEPPDSQWGQNYIEKAGARQCWDLMLMAAPKDSVPAGSGEVSIGAAWLELVANRWDKSQKISPMECDRLLSIAALLRKLQQGAE